MLFNNHLHIRYNSTVNVVFTIDIGRQSTSANIVDTSHEEREAPDTEIC